MGRTRKVTPDLARTVAALLGQGETPKSLREILGAEYGASAITRLTQLAKDMGILRTKTECLLTASVQEQLVLEATEAARLRRALQDVDKKRHLRMVRVFNSRPELAVEGMDDWTSRQIEFSRNAAPFLWKILCSKQTRVVGCAWGTTLRHLIVELEKTQDLGARQSDPLTIFPICGDPIEVSGVPERQSSILIAKLCRILNGVERAEDVFVGVAPVIPSSFKVSEVRIIRRFLLANPKYAAVFGKNGQINKVDTIITGLGTATDQSANKSATHSWMRDVANAASVDESEVQQMLLGNIGGVLLPNSGATKSVENKVQKLNDLSTGIQQKQLSECAKRSKEQGGAVPGVLAFAIGKKEAITLECVREGLINELYIDHDLKNGLLAIL